MSKVRTIFFSIIATIAFTTLFAMTANAQRPNPSDQEAQQWRQRGPCRDPWVSKAVTEYKGSVAGRGDFGECKYTMYNGGSWGSYDELYQGVRTALNNMSGNVTITSTSIGSDIIKIVTDAGAGYKLTQTVKVLPNDGATLISQDGAGIILNGGGNYKTLSTPTEKRINLGKSVLVIRKN
jgi:hypothetical protein